MGPFWCIRSELGAAFSGGWHPRCPITGAPCPAHHGPAALFYVNLPSEGCVTTHAKREEPKELAQEIQ